MKVGIFDSGMGGLSVLHRALQIMPGIDYIYYADKEHVPYGEKTETQVKGYVDEIIRFLIDKGVDAIVIACNTATSVATKEYRSEFPVPIVGMEPAVKRAVEEYKDVSGRVLVAATPITIAGKKLLQLVERVDTADKVDLIALPKLVRFAEEGEFESEQVVAYLEESLKNYPVDDYKALVMGCTHFNYFKENYRKVFPDKTQFVDGIDGTLRQLIRKLPNELTQEDKNGCGKVEYYFSGKFVDENGMDEIHKYLEQLDKVEGKLR